MRAVLAVATTILLAGCQGPWFADQWVVGHFQTSPEWSAPGAWDALPDEGDVGRFHVQLSGFGVPAERIGAPLEEPVFEAKDLDDAWGEGRYKLDFVRWSDGAQGDDRRTIQFEAGYVQIWFGLDRTADEARELFLSIAPKILDEDQAALERMADQMLASERTLQAREATEDTPARPATRLFGTALAAPPDFERLYADHAGLAGSRVETVIDATGWLPVPGQVTLHDGPWQFHLTTMLKRVSDAGSDLVWVAPTDVVQYVHQDRRDLDDAEAAKRLHAAAEELGIEAPGGTWVFDHEPIYESRGD